MSQLNDLVWSHFRKNLSSSEVVNPSIPILYFGNKKGFEGSSLKIVTVGLNPSLNEFPNSDPFRRFPKAEGLQNLGNATPNQVSYEEVLNDYFTEKADPYRRWFNSFEPILNGLDASYYDNRGNTALHTDLCTPLATRTTWSKLKNKDRVQGWVRSLEAEGSTIWHSLMYELKPDIMLVSIARDYLSGIRFPKKSSWRLLSRIEHDRKGKERKPYDITCCIVDLKGKDSLLVFGRAAQTPFSLISDQQKLMIGQKIASFVAA